MPLQWWTSSSSSPNSRKQQQRRLTRAKQLRYLRDTDVKQLDFFLNSPSSDYRDHRDRYRDLTASPQPLPLPDLSALFESGDRLFKVKSKNSRDRFRLPSPTGAPSPAGGGGGGGGSRSCKERGSQRLKSNDRDNSDDRSIISSDNVRIVPRDSQVSIDDQRRSDAQLSVATQRGAGHQWNIHRAETWSSTCLQQSVESEEQVRENFTPNIAFRSAPVSQNVSPMLSPQRVFNGEPFPFFPMESKPLFDPTIASTFPFATPQESNLVSCPASPLHSTLVKNSIPPLNSISRAVSPRRPKLSIEISSTNHDNNSFPPNVHPLPLPPTPHSLGQTSPVPQVAAKPEFLPVKCQWSKGKLIGRGTFGSVYVATNRETGALCAMKEVELLPDDPKSAECMRQLEQEIKVLSDLKHPNIVQYYGSEIVDDRFSIYLEYVYPGSINKYVHDHCGAITEAVVRNFTRHILSGLAYLHSRKTVHRDIKGANLLVDACGVVKLADFGMAKHLSGQAADLSLKGSPYWMAPELMNAVMQKDNNVNQAFTVDIWSLGCTIIEMLTGKPPWSGFEGAAAMFKVLRESPPIPETLSPEGKDFLSCCFRRNPADRPPAIKLLDHPFLRNSQLQDISPSNLLNFSNPIEKTYSTKELYDHRIDKFPMSPNRYTPNGKGGNNETGGLLPHPEPSEQVASSRHSPRSILDPVTTNLSPPWSSPTLQLLIPGNSSNGIIGGTARNVFSPKF